MTKRQTNATLSRLQIIQLGWLTGIMFFLADALQFYIAGNSYWEYKWQILRMTLAKVFHDKFSFLRKQELYNEN